LTRDLPESDPSGPRRCAAAGLTRAAQLAAFAVSSAGRASLVKAGAFHTNAVPFDHAETSAPVFARHQFAYDQVSDTLGRRHGHPEQHEPTGVRSGAASNNSPKSLSKVRRMRPSRRAHAKTPLSSDPAAVSATPTTSSPRSRSLRRTARGMFSSANHFIQAALGKTFSAARTSRA
jgi:hypothetical protein